MISIWFWWGRRTFCCSTWGSPADFRRDCWCHPTCNGPRNAGWDQASRPWQLSWYLLAAAVWAAQLCYVKWCGMVLVWLHNMVKTCQNHYYHTARSDYAVRLRIREGFVHRDKTIVGLACASSFWNRDFKTIARSSSMKNKWPKKRLIWYMDRNFEQKPSSWPRGLPNTSQLGGCLYVCWGLDEEWTCLGCIRIYIYIQIYYMYVYIIKYLVVLYIYIYIFTIYIYMVTPSQTPRQRISYANCLLKKNPSQCISSGEFPLTMHLICKVFSQQAQNQIGELLNCFWGRGRVMEMRFGAGFHVSHFLEIKLFDSYPWNAL